MTDIVDTDLDDAGEAEADPGGHGRRRFLTGGAVAAAAAVAGVALAAEPAGAANGNAITIGSPNNNGTNQTVLTGSTFKAVNGSTSATALIGSHTLSTSSIGVQGIANDGTVTPQGGTGVAGAAGAGGTGVSGTAGGTGTGVSGTSGVGGTGMAGTAGGTGTGVSGTGGDGGTGVAGTSGNGGIGVRGDGTGIPGTGSVGVRGNVVIGSGVLGEALGGNSTLIGDATGSGVRGTSDYGAALFLDETTVTSVPGGGPWSAGSFVVKGGHVWYCYQSGSPGSWVKLSSVFVPLAAPRRVYDTRPGQPPVTVGPKTPIVGPRGNIDLKANSSGVPAGATGGLISVVATGSVNAGFAAFYKNGLAYPGTSNLNFGGGETIAVTSFTALDSAAKMTIFSNQSCDFIVDVLGYYT